MDCDPWLVFHSQGLSIYVDVHTPSTVVAINAIFIPMQVAAKTTAGFGPESSPLTLTINSKYNVNTYTHVRWPWSNEKAQFCLLSLV